MGGRIKDFFGKIDTALGIISISSTYMLQQKLIKLSGPLEKLRKTAYN